jgi:hypothetical protein
MEYLVGAVLKKLTQDQPKLGSTLSAIGGVLGVLVGSFAATLIAVPLEEFGELGACCVMYMAEALFLGPIVGILGSKCAAAFARADTVTGTLAWAFGGGLRVLLQGSYLGFCGSR